MPAQRTVTPTLPNQLVGVDSSPLPTKFHENTFDLDSRGTTLVLGMARFVYLFWWPLGWVLLGAGTWGLGFLVAAWIQNDPRLWTEGLWFCLMPIALSISAGMSLVHLPRFCFDRDAGQLVYRTPWALPHPKFFLHTMPLDRIVGLQIIRGTPKTYDDGDAFQTYQLNLLLDDTTQPRLNMTDHVDLACTQRHGREIADYLSIPLFDLVAGDGADEVGAQG